MALRLPYSRVRNRLLSGSQFIFENTHQNIHTSEVQLEIFQGRGGFVKLGHFDKHFVKNSRKKGPAGKNFRVFSPRYS